MNQKKQQDLRTVRWIYGKTKGQRLRLLTLVAFHILDALLAVWFALVCRELVDSAIAADKGRLLLDTAALLGTILAQLLVSFFTHFLTEGLFARLSISFQDQMLGAVLNGSYSQVTAYHSGELMNRMFSDTGIVVSGVIHLVPSAAYQLFRLLGAAAVLLALSPAFALVFLAVGLLIFTVMTLMRGKLKALHKQVQEAGGRTRSCIQELLTSLLVVRVFGAETRAREKAMEYQEQYRREREKRWKLSFLGNVGFETVFQLGYFLTMVWGCLGIFRGALSYGTLTAMLQLVNQIQSPFAGFSGLLSQYYTVLASAERVMEIEDLPAMEPGASRVDYRELDAIVFDRVDFTYGRTPVLEDVSLRIAKGDTVALTGLSGGGKSTVFLLMMGLYRPTAGSVRLESAAGTRDLTAGDVRGLFAYVPQGHYLFSGTLRENITFLQRDIPEADIWEALELACADAFVRQLPQGLDTLLGEKGCGLSEGQVQRIAIARAILSGAPILMLDEATSALDEETEAQLLRNIQSLQNRTCLIVTHKKAALAICKKHLHLTGGRIDTEAP